MSAEQDVFDREGRWDIRVTIYRNDKRIATCDAGGNAFDFAVGSVVTNLERRDVEMHVPRRRTRVLPPAGRVCGCRCHGGHIVPGCRQSRCEKCVLPPGTPSIHVCPECGEPVTREQPCWVDPETKQRHHDPCPIPPERGQS